MGPLLPVMLLLLLVPAPSHELKVGLAVRQLRLQIGMSITGAKFISNVYLGSDTICWQVERSGTDSHGPLISTFISIIGYIKEHSVHNNYI
jgi:hypothetical protein